MSILQTTDLKKYYGTEPNITKALDGVTLSIEQGEFVAIVLADEPTGWTCPPPAAFRSRARSWPS